jgi:hypothetical protein
VSEEEEEEEEEKRLKLSANVEKQLRSIFAVKIAQQMFVIEK